MGISYLIFQILALLGCTVLIKAQVPFVGKCPKVAVKKNFNAPAYLGRWYEQEKYPFVFELAGRCVTAEYGLNANGTVSVANRLINTITGSVNALNGSARIVQPAKLAVSFPLPFTLEAPYWVIGTDYKKYAVMLSCIELGGIVHTKVVWILTRDRFPSIKTMKKAYAVMDSANISRKYLTRTDQKNCEPSKEINYKSKVKSKKY
ncbi:apolipoprotein D-like [Topomyia yanbarensis]|uniref:apolipoprotein D-like n=1 Tax=Topomyia yanbarensis TaxID=2498891 RepID=UPI00273CEC78|nr:apolipoprotein D-like [Topomyia yanbarensis]